MNSDFHKDKVGEDMTQKHKVFVSYHHENDEEYRNKFDRIMKDHSVIGSVKIGDIPDNLKTETIRQKIRDKYLRDSSVTVVLIGKETWKRKFIDWEISSSIRKTQLNPRSGLIGLVLPTHSDYGRPNYSKEIIPPRLHDNASCGFATIYHWSDKNNEITRWIHEAYLRKDKINPTNSRDIFRNNRSSPIFARRLCLIIRPYSQEVHS